MNRICGSGIVKSTGTSSIQSVVFDKKKWTPSMARRWLKSKSLPRIKRAHSTNKKYRYRVKDPARFRRFISKKTTKGITLIIGYE